MDEGETRRTAPEIDARGLRPPASFAIAERPAASGIAVLALEGELNELHASMDAYAASSDAFWTKVDDLNGVIPYLPPFGSCSLA